jgi:hypothetical protein
MFDVELKVDRPKKLSTFNFQHSTFNAAGAHGRGVERRSAALQAAGIPWHPYPGLAAWAKEEPALWASVAKHVPHVVEPVES